MQLEWDFCAQNTTSVFPTGVYSRYRMAVRGFRGISGMLSCIVQSAYFIKED